MNKTQQKAHSIMAASLLQHAYNQANGIVVKTHKEMYDEAVEKASKTTGIIYFLKNRLTKR